MSETEIDRIDNLQEYQDFILTFFTASDSGLSKKVWTSFMKIFMSFLRFNTFQFYIIAFQITLDRAFIAYLTFSVHRIEVYL